MVSVLGRRDALQRFLAQAKGEEHLRIVELTKLSGGTVQQNWRVQVEWPDGEACWVLRTAEAMGVKDSLNASQEYLVIKAAYAVGVKLPTPLWSCSDPAVLGQDFFVMNFLEGVVDPRKLFDAVPLEEQGDAIVEQVGEELGRIQSVTPGPEVLPFLKAPGKDVATETISYLRAYLDTHELPHPAIEFGLRWLEQNVPPGGDIVLCHGDFRVGNYMVNNGRLQGILDWELAHWGDPHEDLGWLCQRFFRFGRIGLKAGGMADSAALYRGYERTSGRLIDPDVMAYWEIMASVKWAVVSLQQAARYTTGAVDAFELALVGLGTAEMEMEFLDLIGVREGLCHA